MSDILSAAGASLQAALTGQLIKDLSQVVAAGPVSAAPAPLFNLSHTVAVSGTVTSQEQNGAAVVQTAAGPLTVSLPKDTVQLPQGTVTVVIQPGNPPTASILAGQSANTPQATQQTDAAAATLQSAQQVQSQAALQPLTVGQVLTATALPTAITAPPLEDTHSTAATAPPPVGASAPASGTSSSVAASVPTAVLLSSAVAPTYVAAPTGDRDSPAVPANTEKDDAAPLPAQAQPSSTPQFIFPQSQSPAAAQFALLQQQPAPALSPLPPETGEPMVTPSANALAAQEAASQGAPVLTRGVLPNVAPTQVTQSFMVLSVEPPDPPSAPLALGQAPPARMALQTPQAASQGPTTLSATVVAQTPGGQPLLETEDGPLLVHQAVATSVGTGLVLQKLPDQPVAGSAAVVPGQLSSGAPAALDRTPLTISRQPSWPALTQTLASLDRALPGASGFLAGAVPALGGGFVQAFVRFLSAGNSSLATQDAPQLGTARLPDGSPSPEGIDPRVELRAAVTQLAADIGLDGKAQGTVPRADAWHGYQVPMMTDQGINMAQLFVRQMIDPVDDEPGQRKAAPSTRFVVEIHPQRLGPVQLDGLLRNGQGRIERLDLIVRTEFNVPEAASEEMESLFRSALSSSDMTGKLGFQSGQERFVLPQSDGGPHYSGKV